ncbi:CUE domain containing 1b [Elysia marginata]|uniref:CUE domain containing 1b n=1 Tax=Elysia marginata TaxID=1093978 RepID=A0AAV4FKD4_9GAST|nr:CUE domain containing 1b [Elysia marginata]
MSDFCYMFPETDEEVIEAVLRANNGMVDATIDQLLTMNIDADINDDDDLSDKILQTLERDLQQQQTQSPHTLSNTGLPVHSVSSRRSGRESKPSSRFTSLKRPAFRNWNPPLLGTLPDDFLRIVPSTSLPSRPSRHGTHLHRTMSAVGPESRHLNSSPLSSMEAAGGGTAHHTKFKSSSSQKPHRSLSFAGNTAQGRGSQHEFSPDLIQERMKENERRRRMTSIDLDPALAMYLEDERLALMLQNSEFLQELRGDRMFMLTLERDQKSGDLERLKRESSPETLHPVSFDDENRDFIEGYGEDRQNTLEAFPFSQQLPPPVSEDVELRKKLKNMGKASRKQFAALARKFFMKRRKKTAQQILRGTQAPSMVNLLDEDEDDIDEENHVANDNHNADSYDQNSNTQDESGLNLTSSPKTRRRFDVV